MPDDLYFTDSETSTITINYANIQKTTFEDRIDLSYNGEVFFSIGNNDMIGNGSISDPFVVRSTIGFLFLTNQPLSKIYLIQKRIEIDCDIVLNDELFDKYGNISGGDKVVYSWNATSGCSSACFNGNGHTIYGLYKKDTLNQQYAGLFCNGSIVSEVKDLTIDSFYIYGKSYAFSLFAGIKNLINFVSKNGYIEAGQTAAGFSYILYKAKNCINYSTVKGPSYIGGFSSIMREDGSIEDCKNYGYVSGNTHIGGIVGSISKSPYIYFDNVSNFGQVEAFGLASMGNSAMCGGLIGSTQSFEGTIVFNKCKSQGSIKSHMAYAGGLIGFQEGNIICENCVICASIDIFNQKQRVGVVIGAISDSYINVTSSFIMRNCNIKSNNLIPVIGNLHCKREGLINMRNNVLSYSSDTIPDKFSIVTNTISSTSPENNVMVFELKVNISKAKSVTLIYDSEKNNPNIKLTNIYVSVMSSATFFIENDKSSCDGIVFNSLTEKSYLGSDFSKYYYSWKTGKIGLIAIDGRGLFQKKVDEEFLLNMDFEKKVR